MRASNPAGQCETQADAACLAGAAAVGAPERRTCACELVGTHTDTTIDDLEVDRFTVWVNRQFYRRARLRILRRIIEQVIERTAQQHRIALDRALAVVHILLERASRMLFREPRGCAVGNFSDTDRLALDGGIRGLEARRGEDVFDELVDLV